jgi:crotonobetainyl-CoA:carnitine CoA-transferase CaiB-like acyl-CoA transferase
MSTSPLTGVKVLELARVLAGPWSGQVLADLGADVIKVESSTGDDTRRWGPPFVDNLDGTQDAAYFHAANRGKQSVIVDFATADGAAEIRRLVADADVLVENFKVDGLKKYGLDYESLHKLNPRLIYCSITGYGQDGPYAARAGYDFIIQGISGVMDLTGDPNGEPQKMGVAFADIFAGLYAVIGIQAALRHCEATGQGQHLDISLLDCMVGVLANQALNYLSSGESPKRLGNKHPNIAPYEAYPVRDGWFILAVGNDNQFRRFCNLVGLAELPNDDLFRSNAERVRNRELLSERIAFSTKKWSRDKLLNALNEAGVPAGPINTIEQAFADPQVRSRQMQLSMSRAGDDATVPGIRTPITFSQTKLAATKASPQLGNGSARWKKHLRNNRKPRQWRPGSRVR